MKIKLTILFVVSFQLIHGQQIHLAREIDTLRIIEAFELPDMMIEYQMPNCTVYFSKEITIRSWNETLLVLEDDIQESDNVKDWQVELLDHFKQGLSFIEKNDTLILSNPWDADSIINYEQIENNELLMTSRLFYEVGCEMLDLGYYLIYKDSIPIKTIIKAEVVEGDHLSTTRSIKYLIDRNEEIWTCPPIIHSSHY